MDPKRKIEIISKLSPEFSSNVTVDNMTYHVQTEDLGVKSHKIISNVFLNGKVVYSRKNDYSELIKLENFKEKLGSIMEKFHKATVDEFIAEQSRKQKPRSEYFDEVQQLLKKGSSRAALDTLRHALEQFPLDPFLLSYYGCLVAIVDNDPKKGIIICTDAINRLDDSMPFGREFFYPVFYLNLGRAYLKGNDKKEALKIFKEGLKHDPDNRDLQVELKKLGIRKKTVVPFLERSNPLNKYIGMMLSKTSRKGKP